MLFYSIFRTTLKVSSKLNFVEICQVSEKLWPFNHKTANFWLRNFGFRRLLLSLLKAKGPHTYPTLKQGNKTAKTNPKRVQLFAESVKRNFIIKSHLFRKSHFDPINKFIEAHSYHFTPLDSLHDNMIDNDDDIDLVADVDPDTLIRFAYYMRPRDIFFYVRERLITVGQKPLSWYACKPLP